MGLIARDLEAAGIATLCMSSALDITRAVRPPRAVFLDFPLGHTAGKPHAPELQRRILGEALEALGSMTVPGSVAVLAHSWSADDSWKEEVMHGDQRTPRYDTPQYQVAADRVRAEVRPAAACAVCGLPAHAAAA